MKYIIGNTNQKTENSLSIRYRDESLVLTYFYKGSECGFSFARQQENYHLEFQFSREYLDKIDFDLSTFDLSGEKSDSNICCNTQLILHQVIHTKYEGKYKKIFIESKALELLLCTFHFLEDVKSPCESCKFLNQPLEKEKILQAREIILQSLHQPPTIPELARQIGINQCYLKKGFKEMFKSTVYEFVIEQRMLKAKILLSLNNQSVSQIAEEVGYSNTSNFSNAFKRYTGLYPTELSKN